MNVNTDPKSYTSVDTSDIIGTINLNEWDGVTPIKLHDQYITAVKFYSNDRAMLALSDYAIPYSESRVVFNVWYTITVDVCNHPTPDYS